ncbi:MAG TPA: hypothetical protein VGH81_09155 [Rudaea sp.]|jgi:ElaB/YqjD/DUF883 family membrane-anchored ribosome-binding protein
MSAQSAKSTVTPIDTSVHESTTEEVEEAAAAATEDTLGELEDQLRQTADSLKESARALGDLATLQIQQRPLAAIGVAFLAGLAAARMLRR